MILAHAIDKLGRRAACFTLLFPNFPLTFFHLWLVKACTNMATSLILMCFLLARKFIMLSECFLYYSCVCSSIVVTDFSFRSQKVIAASDVDPVDFDKAFCFFIVHVIIQYISFILCIISLCCLFFCIVLISY